MKKNWKRQEQKHKQTHKRRNGFILAELKEQIYSIIYVKIREEQIQTWPALAIAEAEKTSAESEKTEEKIPEAIDLGNGKYQVVPQCRLTIDGVTWKYIGKESGTVDGPGTRKGKKYWKRVMG